MIDESAWAGLREQLRAVVGADIYESWFPRLQFDSVVGSTVRLSVPTRFLRTWITQHYLDRLTDLWRTVAPDAEVQIVVRSAIINPRTDGPQLVRLMREMVAVPPVRGPEPEAAPVATSPSVGSPVDSRWTLETCCVGDPNRLAFAAAQRVATSYRAPVFNPLFIHGGPGLGKSRLLQSIANAAGDARVLHLSGERFTYGYFSAVKDNQLDQFRRALRNADLLLIDDLQAVRGKLAQAEFSYLIMAMMEFGRQVVITSDRAPGDHDGFDARMVSRLSGGLATEIEPFDSELAVKVAGARVAALTVQDPAFAISDELAAMLAEKCGRNGRDVEAAVNRLFAHAQLGGALTVEAAGDALRDLVRTEPPRRVRVEQVLKAVAEHYKVTRADILSQRRTANVVKPRQIAMYLAKTLTLRSLPEIGRRFGGRDHTTVLHAVRKIEGLRPIDDALAEELNCLTAALTSEVRV